MEKKTRYTVVNKMGKEVYHADSYLGFVGKTILVQLLSCLALAVIAMIICGIASIF